MKSKIIFSYVKNQDDRVEVWVVSIEVTKRSEIDSAGSFTDNCISNIPKD